MCPVTCWDVESVVAQSCACVPTPGKKAVEGVGWKKLWDLLFGDSALESLSSSHPSVQICF